MFAKCQTPTEDGRDILSESFPMPRFNERKFKKLAEKHDIDLDDINVQRLVEEFQLHHRHLLIGDHSDEEKKRILKKMPAPSDSSEYPNALFFLEVFMSSVDRTKACAILYCFERLGK